MQNDEDELLDEAAACRFIGGSKPINPATLWRGMRDGIYSKPIKVSPNGVRWLKSDLLRDRERMIAERDSKRSRKTASAVT